MSRRRRIVYLLEDTALFGGVKVVLRQAELLVRAGEDVHIVTKGEVPTWTEVQTPLTRVPVFTRERIPECEVLIATYWTTLAPATRARARRVVHYCQGHEGDYTHNVDDHAEIQAAYRLSVPAFCVSPHLERRISNEYGRPARTVVQPLEAFWRPQGEPPPTAAPRRILVPGPWEIDWKGVKTCLQAFRSIRGEPSANLSQLIRLSQWPQSTEERELAAAHEFHHHVTPREAAAVVRSCDLALVGSWSQEGFGLPALEAMASGVPVVLTDIDCYRSWAPSARKVPPGNSAALARAALDLLEDPAAWNEQRERGLALAESFSEERATASIVEALNWAEGLES